ncbi:MAG: N-acetylmuramoyl-L-alanine amidase [Candidatus Paralactobacillus gallistercoris]|uniref:N-acetylmuramoyl-L-alanine amidase n=1 Tax=Candidatus Paralactobacillus gallistercoris TaxID=2838724 RepID=A0A948TIU4_9LACO|nr:N-acetylmuramoyl-L-alanine amidase [Candidatus Paralactobacillus gallistercoris]
MKKHNYRYLEVLILSCGLLTCWPNHVHAATQHINSKSNHVQVYAGPGLSYQKITTINSDDKIDVLTQKNNWYEVRINNNHIGWIPSWLVTNHVQYSSTTNQTAMAITKANVYKSNSTKSKKIGQLAQGDKVTVVYQQNNWCQIIYNHHIAWVATNALSNSGVKVNAKEHNTSTSVKKVKPKTVKYVIAQQANTKIRANTDTNGKVLQAVTAHTKMTYLSTKGNWYKVKYNGQTGYVASWISKLVTVSVQPIPTDIANATIVIDPGHGGADNGTTTTNNHNEKTYTLKMAEVLAKQLRNAGAKVILTRKSDKTLSATKRAADAKQANVFISLHFDNNNNSGITTYYNNSNANLARQIDNQFSNLPLTNNGITTGSFDVLNDIKVPGVLLELGNIDNPKDYQSITNSNYREQVAKDIVTGLKAYCKGGSAETIISSTGTTSNNSITATQQANNSASTVTSTNQDSDPSID